MFSVALLGADGSGKTTISDALAEQLPVANKYIYMGTAIRSSNITLPTTRLILYLKERRHNRSAAKTDSGEFTEYSDMPRGKIGAALSLLNRLAEEWYRQVVAWIYKIRGYVVIFDRHFIFEHAAHARKLRERGPRLSDRIHLWFLYNLYPEPDLVLFLDAPAEVLMARKLEWSKQRLEEHRKEVLELGSRMPDFVRIDATQSIDQVLASVITEIMRVFESRKSGDR